MRVAAKTVWVTLIGIGNIIDIPTDQLISTTLLGILTLMPDGLNNEDTD